MKIEHFVGLMRSSVLLDRVLSRIDEVGSAFVFDYVGEIVPRWKEDEKLVVRAESWEDDRVLIENAARVGVELVVLYRPEAGYVTPEGVWQPPWKELLSTLHDRSSTFLVVSAYRNKERDRVPAFEPWVRLADVTVRFDQTRPVI